MIHRAVEQAISGDRLSQRPSQRAPRPPPTVHLHGNSHLHCDHCGGNTILSGGSRCGPAAPAFPRARYLASRGEWEHAHERLARDRVSYIDANYDPLVESGRMTLVDGDYEAAPRIWMRRAPSRGETFCFLSDLVPTTAHLQLTWVAAFDLYPLEAIDNKIRWLSAAAEGNWLCGFAHDVETGFTRIARDAKTGFTAAQALRSDTPSRPPLGSPGRGMAARPAQPAHAAPPDRLFFVTSAIAPSPPVAAVFGKSYPRGPTPEAVRRPRGRCGLLRWIPCRLSSLILRVDRGVSRRTYG